MAADFEIRGSDDIDALVRRIKAHGDARAIRREMGRGLNRATAPIRESMRDKLGSSLPQKGGLAALIAGDFSANTSAKSGRYAGVTIFAKAKGHDIRTIEGGRVRHPLFGNRAHWFEQSVDSGVLEEAFEGDADEVRRQVTNVMNDIARKVES